MPIQHLAPGEKPERIVEILERDGCAVVDRLADPALLEQIARDVEPHLECLRPGPDEFAGLHTRRAGGLIARSPAARELIAHPAVLAAVGGLLAHATSFQLHLTQLIAIGPGERAQAVHRDQWAFDFFPFPKGYEVQCNTIWAMTDFRAENGATRVIPGSHRYEDRLSFKEEDTEPAEMQAGSALFYTGSLYHGGGANRSDRVRMGLNITYALSWLRQEENQYLSVPLDVARTLPEELLRLMGYARGAYALGYVDDLRDPMEVVRPVGTGAGLGGLEAARERLRRRDPDR